LRSLVVLSATAALALPAAAQQRRLTAHELGAGGVAALAAATFVGGGLVAGYRPATRARVALAAAAGALDGTTAVRVEAAAHFVLNPAARRGTSPYAGGGVAFQGADGVPGAGYLVLLVGLEGAPGRRSGWYLEAGIGGGARVAVGWRWRRFPSWWR
jgi:hypothetical protein